MGDLNRVTPMRQRLKHIGTVFVLVQVRLHRYGQICSTAVFRAKYRYMDNDVPSMTVRNIVGCSPYVRKIGRVIRYMVRTMYEQVGYHHHLYNSTCNQRKYYTVREKRLYAERHQHRPPEVHPGPPPVLGSCLSVEVPNYRIHCAVETVQIVQTRRYRVQTGNCAAAPTGRQMRASLLVQSSDSRAHAQPNSKGNQLAIRGAHAVRESGRQRLSTLKVVSVPDFLQFS